MEDGKTDLERFTDGISPTEYTHCGVDSDGVTSILVHARGMRSVHRMKFDKDGKQLFDKR